MTASDSPVREGDLVAGKYRVGRLLGEGGMGVVVAAVHEQLHQPVAIKFVRHESLGNPDVVARFLREARAAAGLKSEHVAKVTDVGTLESGAPYMVMEMLEGSDLHQVLEQRGSVPIELAADWLIQTCEAVAEAHAAGIVHRDLKPQNLFLARTVGGGSTIKVLDFGVSKSIVAANLTVTSALLGSPLYMSPEQMRSSRDVTPRADVWALGVVFFELLTGRLPFEAATLPELCFQVASDPPIPITTLLDDVPPDVVALIERCLQKDPSLRFADAAELATALEPLAPPESSVVAERARMAMGPLHRTYALPDPSRKTARTWKSGDVQNAARAARTPAAWDSRAKEAGRKTGAWIAGAVGLAVTVAGALFWVLFHARGGAPPILPETPSSSALSANTARVVEPAEPVAAAPPAPAASTVEVTADAASASAATPPSPSVASSHAGPGPSPAPPRPARPQPLRPQTARPAGSGASPRAAERPQEDDIPAMR
jgi:eukaryotic-like serine/threonine-protein kinase